MPIINVSSSSMADWIVLSTDGVLVMPGIPRKHENSYKLSERDRHLLFCMKRFHQGQCPAEQSTTRQQYGLQFRKTLNQESNVIGKEYYPIWLLHTTSGLQL